MNLRSTVGVIVGEESTYDYLHDASVNEVAVSVVAVEPGSWSDSQMQF